jgi:hypothetical protein
VEKSEGGEQQVRCREAEAGVHFIRPGRRWRGGEEAGGGGVLIPIGLERVKARRGDGMALIRGGSEGSMTTLRFGSSRAK